MWISVWLKRISPPITFVFDVLQIPLQSTYLCHLLSRFFTKAVCNGFRAVTRGFPPKAPRISHNQGSVRQQSLFNPADRTTAPLLTLHLSPSLSQLLILWEQCQLLAYYQSASSQGLIGDSPPPPHVPHCYLLKSVLLSYLLLLYMLYRLRIMTAIGMFTSHKTKKAGIL